MNYDLLNEVSLLYDMKEYHKAVKTLLDVYPGDTTIEEIKKRLDEKMRIQENKIGENYKLKPDVVNGHCEEQDVLSDDSKLTWDTIDDLNNYFGTDYKDFSSVDWRQLSEYYVLPESFIRKFSDNVNWSWVSIKQNLSENFIREFAAYVDWGNISMFQQLSEDFIREFKNCVNWLRISCSQRLSENFMREFVDMVDFEYISRNQHLSIDFIKDFAQRLDMEAIRRNWIYKDSKFKKQKVVNTGRYVCYDEYFIAYKRIRTDRYGLLFQHKYEKDGVYESWCDCSNDELSDCGLIVWDKETAGDFQGGMVVKVKVRYEDVGRVVQDGKRIRCFKIEVLE